MHWAVLRTCRRRRRRRFSLSLQNLPFLNTVARNGIAVLQRDAESDGSLLYSQSVLLTFPSLAQQRCATTIGF